MKKNVGTLDQTLRVLIGIALVGMALMELFDRTISLALIGVAIVLIITSLAARCPLYWVTRLSTAPKDDT